MTTKLFGPYTVKIPRYVTEAIDASGQPGVSGYRSKQVGFTVADIHISIDMEALAKELGGKAIKNKEHRSRYLGGDVVVEAVNIRKES
jgi:hypothetical protein